MGKSVSGFWGNPSPILDKPAPFLGKTCSVFGENRLRFLGKTGSVFGKNRIRFWDKLALCLRKTNSNFGTAGSVLGWKLARFLDWLGTKAQVSLL